jgi:hypothetical protein
MRNLGAELDVCRRELETDPLILEEDGNCQEARCPALS